MISKGSRESEAAQRGAKRRREKRTKPTEARKEKRPDRPTRQRQKGATGAENETGTRKADSETIHGRTHHRGRKRPTHIPTTGKRAPSNKQQREERTEKRGKGTR